MAGLSQVISGHASPDLGLQVQHLYLGVYISFADEVTVDDIARGMKAAIYSFSFRQ